MGDESIHSIRWSDSSPFIAHCMEYLFDGSSDLFLNHGSCPMGSVEAILWFFKPGVKVASDALCHQDDDVICPAILMENLKISEIRTIIFASNPSTRIFSISVADL
eukprot:TRINITY_DN7696_c0_g2_i1.p3 TRINITY_DN7696_c0_g2~~TRINITY_DN7696_c0_g2_i1.p3  ORF type:complete len:106 (-),score=20.68 TRINITY_DN7696_c0_g2_i1:614-931(-)